MSEVLWQFKSSHQKQLMAPMDYKYRLGHFSKTKEWAFMLAYIDARDVMDRLDSVLGPERWSAEHYALNGTIYCRLSIHVAEALWVSKTDCGSESDIEKEKGASSDAFKRAAVHWGIGRFLYDFPTIMLKKAEFDSVQYDKDKLYAACEARRTGKGAKKGKPTSTRTPEPDKVEDFSDTQESPFGDIPFGSEAA